MDGEQARVSEPWRQSLQFRLSLSLAVVSLVAALVGGAVSFASALAEAHELQDSMLMQMAALAALTPAQAAPRTHAPPQSSSSSHDEADEESQVTVQWLPAPGSSAPASAPLVPPGLADGVHTVAIGGEDHRIVLRTLPDGARVVVAQEAGMRNEIARASALRTIAPMLALAPLLVAVVVVLVRRLLRPMQALSTEVNARAEEALHPVEARDVPPELRPFIDAINGLLRKVRNAMDVQRRFLADAAHELRSPLAALSLQAERLAQAEMSATATERLGTVRLGIERARHLLEQLLSLARAQASPATQATTPVSVRTLARSVIEDFVSLAEAKGIDLGMTDSDDATIDSNEMALATILRNLVDNAIRYSPAGSQVDVAVQTGETLGAQAVCIRVSDHGPGIPPQERERVFDPFYRVLGSDESGSGLGLAIVKELAMRLGADVTLADAHPDAASPHARGLAVTVRLPGPAGQPRRPEVSPASSASPPAGRP